MKVGKLFLFFYFSLAFAALSPDLLAQVVPLKTKEILVRGAVLDPEIVGDEHARIRLDILLLQGGRVNWDLLKNPKTFLPFQLGGMTVQEMGVPLDPDFKDYNLFEVLILLSLPDKPNGKYESEPLPIDYTFIDYKSKDNSIRGVEVNKKVYIQGFSLSKVSLRAFLEAERKSMEIGDQYLVSLSIVSNLGVKILNLRYQEGQNSSLEKDKFLDNVQFNGHEMLEYKIEEKQKNSVRAVTRVNYRLISFELPPQEFKLGPLAVLYRDSGAEDVKQYVTSEVVVKLNSVLTAQSRFEGVRQPSPVESRAYFWQVTAPYYGAAALAVIWAIAAIFWIAGRLLSSKKRGLGEEPLPIQKMLLESRSPFFWRHWLYLWLNRGSVASSNKEAAEEFIYRFRICLGSAAGLSFQKAAALTAGNAEEIDRDLGLFLSRLEADLFERTSTVSGKEFEKLFWKPAHIKIRSDFRRLSERLRSLFRDRVRNLKHRRQ